MVKDMESHWHHVYSTLWVGNLGTKRRLPELIADFLRVTARIRDEFHYHAQIDDYESGGMGARKYWDGHEDGWLNRNNGGKDGFCSRLTFRSSLFIAGYHVPAQ